jgi:hypothetical protein
MQPVAGRVDRLERSLVLPCAPLCSLALSCKQRESGGGDDTRDCAGHQDQNSNRVRWSIDGCSVWNGAIKV